MSEFPSDWITEVIELAYEGRTMEVEFHRGPLADHPTTHRVLDCVVSESREADLTFEEWCAEFGDDPDSRRAHATWEAVRAQDAELRDLLGADYDLIVGKFDPERRNTFGVTSDLD